MGNIGKKGTWNARLTEYEAGRQFVLPQMVRRRAEESPEFPLIQQIGYEPITAASFHASCLRLANALHRFGIGQGDRVAVMLRPSPIPVMTWLASSWLRAWEVPINPEYKGRTLVHTLNDSQTRIIFVDSTNLPTIAAIEGELEYLTTAVQIDGEFTVDAGLNQVDVVSLDEFIADAKPVELAGPLHSDPYGVLYTSGTTGPSKGVVRPWAGFHESQHAVFPRDVGVEYEDPAVYAPWATFHSSGKTSSLIAIQRGMRLVLRDGFSLSGFWSDVRDFHCTHALLVSVGPMLWNRRQSADRDTPLRRALALPLFEEFKEFESYFDVQLSSAWGMTEIGLPLGAAAPANHRSCGRPVPGFEMRIVDEQDRDVPRGLAGELLVRHERPFQIALEYFNRPEATAKAWRDGWFHTGDALREDENGDFYFVDRMNDYVRYRGHNVSSLEVEAEVRAHLDVADCACVGIKDGFGSGNEETPADGHVTDEEIKVYVVRTAGSVLTPWDLSDYLVSRMPRMMLPRFIEFVDELPRTPTHKVRKVDLRHLAHGPQVWDREADLRRESAPAGPEPTQRGEGSESYA